MGSKSVSTRRAWRWGVGIAVVAMLASCVPPSDPGGDPGALGLRVTLGDGELLLSWNDTGGAPVELEVLRPGQSWSPLPTPTGSTASFVPEETRERYGFRIRIATPPGVPKNSWERSGQVLYVEPTLPVVRINTDGFVPIVDKETRLPGDFEIDPNGSEFDAYNGRIEINGRGNSTWNASKKPWRIRLDTASELMGMPSNRHWVMLANSYDKSQLRTALAMELSRATDLAWTPRFRHVELILNGEYHGVYQIGEHVRRGSDRVNIANLRPQDISGENLTGGYLLEVDRRIQQTGAPGFVTDRNVAIALDTPDPAMPDQFAYIRDYINDFESTLFSPGFADPVTGYRQYFDVDSFIDWHLVEEITKNDTFFSSGFFYKDRGDVIRFGPVWDFDQAVGLGGVDPAPSGWHSRSRGAWTRRMFQDPAFVDRYAERFGMFRREFHRVPATIEALGDSLRPAIRNDEARWRYSLSEDNEAQAISSWLQARLAWIEAELGPWPEIVPVVVNEVESSDPNGGPDWVELHNLGDETVDLNGYVLKDDNDSRDDRLSVSIAPGGFVVLTEGEDFGFGLGSNDEVRLFEPDGVTLVDRVSWSSHPQFTWGRCPDGTGPLEQNGSPTPGAPNNCTPPVPDPDPDPSPNTTIRITEWMYAGAGQEFVELTNVGTEPVDLTGWSYDDDGATPGAFDLSPFGVVLPGESVVFVEAPPASFRTDWGLCDGVKIIGPYTNNLGRVDQINIFDDQDRLVDVLTYGDNVIPGSPRTQNRSAWVTAQGLGVDDATLWVLSTVGDSEGSISSSGGDVGSPGRSTRATVAFDPCSTGG